MSIASWIGAIDGHQRLPLSSLVFSIAANDSNYPLNRLFSGNASDAEIVCDHLQTLLRLSSRYFRKAWVVGPFCSVAVHLFAIEVLLFR